MTVTFATKRALAKLICEKARLKKRAREYFGISDETSTCERLEAMNKPALISFLMEQDEDAETALSRLNKQFIMRKSPTLYMVTFRDIPKYEKIKDASQRLAKRGRNAGRSFGPNDAVRFLYHPEVCRKVQDCIEFVFHYERRLEFVESDPVSPKYGEPKSDYSLETSVLWLPIVASHHGILACCDYPAIRCIFDYFFEHFQIDLNTPRLDIDTLKRLAGNAAPRRATFVSDTAFNNNNEVTSITLADRTLSNKKPFNQISCNPAAELTSGFYMGHEGLVLGGIGIARDDGKIWTPSHLDRNALLNLALILINKTEIQLRKRSSLDKMIKHYAGDHARIGDRELRGQRHAAYVELAIGVFEANAKPATQRDVAIRYELTNKLVQYKHDMGLVAAITLQCPSCSNVFIGNCIACGNTLDVVIKNGIAAYCQHCHRDVDQITCECGKSLDISNIDSKVRLLPEKDLIESITTLAKQVNKAAPKYFLVRGNTIRIPHVHASRTSADVGLADLRMWIRRARFNVRHIPTDNTQLESIIRRSKEKCPLNAGHPTRTNCENCFNKKLKLSGLGKGKYCLPRLFGIPIDYPFNGIHHGREFADVHYRDTIESDGKQIKIALHLKSRHARVSEHGLGRSISCIKSLYTQVCFSAYINNEEQLHYAVIGVALPNMITPSVVDSMRYVVNRLGLRFMIVDERDWLKIADAAVEKLS